MSEDEDTIADEGQATGALQDTEQVTAVWESLRAQGAHEVDPEQSLVGAYTLNPADPGSKALGPAAVHLTELEPLRLLGADAQFRQVSVLGEGGMGQVHLSVDRALRREVAVKTVRDGAPERETQALVQEAFFTGFLEHPNVVPVHRLGQAEDGGPVLVMKRVVGTSWLELLKDPAHDGWDDLPDDRLRANLGILIRVCDAVRFAHSKGILHRDIKPANVMVGEFGEVYLVDWGVAVRTRDLGGLPATIVGTLAYMAPEMLELPTELSERTDVYLLGSTLHQVLTGTPRHRASGQHALIHKVFRSEPATYGPEVPDELAELCVSATHVDPSKRPQDALSFRRALERYLDHRGSITLTDAADEQLTALRGSPALEPGALRSLFDACRFGYEQALRIWPENPDAARGLQSCLEWGIDYELSQRNKGLVETLLRALPEPRPELEARFASLSSELAAEAQAPKQLEELKRSHDVSVGSRERARATLSLTLSGYGACLSLFLGSPPVLNLFEVDYPALTAFGLLVGAILLWHVWFYGGWLSSTKANQRLVAVAVVGWAVSLFSLLTCWVYQLPQPTFLLVLALLLVMIGALTTVTVDRRMWFPTVLGVASVWTEAVFSGLGPLLIHTVAGLLIFGSVAAIWYRAPSEEPVH